VIEQIDRRLQQWVENLFATEPEAAAAGRGAETGRVPVGFSLGPPRRAPDGAGVSCYLFELCDAPPARGPQRAPLQLALRYLVTTWAQEPAAAHRLLGRLVFAAMGEPEWEVLLAPPSEAAWAAFGVLPQPAFILSIPLRLERPTPPAPLVRAPIQLQATPVASLAGVVLGPGEIPLAGALVELPALRQTRRTDRKGQFAFPMVPVEPAELKLHVKARGRARWFDITRPSEADGPLVIHFELFDAKEE
jgi:hypothetical protein